jgi:hypothetical protein
MVRRVRYEVKIEYRDDLPANLGPGILERGDRCAVVTVSQPRNLSIGLLIHTPIESETDHQS